jgi:hypothetical protein
MINKKIKLNKEESIHLKNSLPYNKLKINFYLNKVFDTTFFLSDISSLKWDNSGEVLIENIKSVIINNKKISNGDNINKYININKKNYIKIILDDYINKDIRLNYNIDYFYYTVNPNKDIKYDKIRVYGKAKNGYTR